jgi:PST family polysaccharide transporter
LTPSRPLDRATLDAVLAKGVLWTGGLRLTGQLITWLSTLVAARLLTPEDYGIVGMATIVLGLVTLLSEFGLGLTVVTLRHLTPAQIAQLNLTSALLGLAAFAAGTAAAVPLAKFFSAPALPGVVIALSAAFVIASLRTVPVALLERDLRFGAVAVVEAAHAFALASCTVGLALLGLGYWALVGGRLAGTAIATCLALLARPCSFAWPRSENLGHAMNFSRHVLVSRLAWYCYSSADSLSIGRVLGQAALGSYSLALSIANIPVEKVTMLVARVTPAVFAAAAEADCQGLQRYFLSLTRTIALVTFPLSALVALLADDLVLVALGARWETVVAPLRLLAIYASFRSIAPLVPQILNVVGESRFGMWNGLVAMAVLVPAFYAATAWGPAGVAAAWMIVHPLVTLPLYWRLFRRLELPARRYSHALAPALSGCVLLAVAVLALHRLLSSDLHPALRLIVELTAGSTLYLAAVAVLFRAALHTVFTATRRALTTLVAPDCARG